MVALSDSVGLNAANQQVDVQVVQGLLLGRGYPVAPSGICDVPTSHAIITFQGGFLKHPDGRIDPGGKTWRKLSGTRANGEVPPAAARAAAAPVGKKVAKPPRTLNEYQEVIAKPKEHTYNIGLTPTSNSYLIGKFGEPRSEKDYSQQDQPLTNKRLDGLMTPNRVNVGPFKVRGMKAAVESLKLIFAEIAVAEPALYAMLETQGMLVVRLVRPSKKNPNPTSISNHSWGTAVDIQIAGILDARGDNNIQKGLALIAPYFNKYKWYWGMAFKTEDSMHFECSKELVETFPT